MSPANYNNSPRQKPINGLTQDSEKWRKQGRLASELRA